MLWQNAQNNIFIVYSKLWSQKMNNFFNLLLKLGVENLLIHITDVTTEIRSINKAILLKILLD